MAYVKKDWEDLPNQTTPVTANDLDRIENGIEYNDQRLNGTKSIDNTIYANDFKCRNLFNKNDVTLGYYIDTSGNLVSASGVFVSGYIEVEGGKTYHFNDTRTRNSSHVFYDANRTYISGSGISSPYNFTTPSNAKYIRINGDNTNLDSYQLELGTSATTFTPYIGLVKEKDGYVKENATFYANDFKCKNMFNKNNYSSLGGFINSSTSKITGNANTKSVYIPIEANTTYTVSKTKGNRFAIATTSVIPELDVSLSNIVENNSAKSLTLTSSSSAKYLVAYVYNSGADTDTLDSILATLQIEEGNATPYTPYKDFDNTEYIAWNNPTPNAAFTGQQITLSDDVSKYSKYEVISRIYYNDPGTFTTGKLPIGKTTLAFNDQFNRGRNITAISGTSLTFGGGYYFGTYGNGTPTTNNNYIIPIQVILYK